MWWSRRFVLTSLPALAACGFAPVYGPGGAGGTLQGRIAFPVPDTREEYLLTRNLETRLGRAEAAEFELALAVAVASQGQAITAAGDITRFSLVGTAEFALRRIADDTLLLESDVENFTGYSATGSTVETLAAADDALDRLMQVLADQIATQLLTRLEQGA